MADTQSIQMWSYRLEQMDPGDISGYSVHARDGDIGKVDKHDVDTGRSCLLVKTGPWIFGRTVMLPAGVVERIDHEHETVHVARTKDEIKHAPEYHADGDGDEYREQLGGYYAQQGDGF